MTALSSLLALAVGVSFAVVAASCLINAVFRGEHLTLNGPGLRYLLWEWLSTLRAYGLRPLFAARPVVRRHSTPFPAQPRRPVVLVPGYSLNRSSLQAVARYLRRCGWEWVHVINNSPYDAPVNAYAQNLAREIAVVRAASGAQEVDIVAHSMGGLVASTYIHKHGGAGVVRTLVTLGTPWQGSRIWILGRRSHVQELAPGHTTVAQAAAPPCRVVSLWSPHDNIILPPESSRIEFGRNVVFRRVGHCGLLYAHQVHLAVGEALVDGEPGA